MAFHRTRISRSGLLLLFWIFATARMLSAQSRDYQTLRDSLNAIPDSSASQLHVRAELLASRAAGSGLRAEEQANLLIERGLLLLRMDEAASDRDFAADAVKAFTRATQLAPASPWAHYGVALAYLASPEIRIGGFGGIFSKLTIAQIAAEIIGEDPASRARVALRHVLELDPGFAQATIELAQLALATRNKDELTEARDAVKTALSAHASSELAIMLADLAVALADPDAAETAANAVAATTPDSSVALHVIGSVFMRVPGQETRGTTAYLVGIEKLTPAGAARYHDDVAFIASDLERTQWADALDSKTIDKRRDWVRGFWNVRAARSAVPVEERIVEHYRRLDVALSKYYRSQKRGAPEAHSVLLEPQSERLPFDDRGIVYVRYGKPDQVIRTNAAGLHPNETWLYNGIEGARQFFHFVASRGSHDFTLVDDILTAATDNAPAESVIALIEDRLKLDPRYGIFAARLRSLQFGTASSDQLTSFRLDNAMLATKHREEVLASLRRDAAEKHFEHEIPFYYDLYNFKGLSSSTDVTAAIAIPGSMLQGRVLDGRLVYGVAISVIFIDTLSSRVERKDTTLRFWSSRVLGPRDNLRLHMNLSATPSTSTVTRVAIENLFEPGAGNVYAGRMEVRDFTGKQLMLSEIVLADSTTRGPWQRDMVQLSLLPPRQINEGSMFSLFYEIYNLPAGNRYRTELLIQATEGGGLVRGVRKLLGGGSGEVRLSFEEEARSNVAGTAQELRRIRAELKPGRYRARVQVTDLQSGQVAVREKLFLINSDKAR